MSAGRGFKNRSAIRRIITLFTVAVFSFLLWPDRALAAGASLKISPAGGIYEVGGLVDVSFIVDTGGDAINAIQTDVLFPPDKLQVVNPVASTSFISLWVTPPTYSNTDGTVHFQGGLPTPGVRTSGGVISTVTFRIKAPGTATIRFAPTSRVLKNDGAGTNILTSTASADFTLKIPPPAGPIVTSPTHPDTNSWFNNGTVQYQWEVVDGAVGYSYTFDQSQKTIPDDTIDTTSTAATVKTTGDGIWYFHIRAKTETWGGVTSVPVQIDTTPPAAFNPSFDKKTITVEDVPTLRFVTSDAASGIDHYEVKQVTVSGTGTQPTTLFIETASPYTTNKLAAGKYKFIVRAFDRAGNSQDGSVNLEVVAGGLPFYARVPLLRSPAVANGALVALAVAALALVGFTIRRRFRLRATFQHDLVALEHDAKKKSEALEHELAELRQAQELVNQGLGSIPVVPQSQTSAIPASEPPTMATPPTIPESPKAPPMPESPKVESIPASSIPAPVSPYSYQPPVQLPPT